MARSRRSPAPSDPAPLRLMVPRPRAEELIDRHHREGLALREDAVQVSTEAEYEAWCNRVRRWEDLTERGLQTIVSTAEFADGFRDSHRYGAFVIGQGFEDDLRDDRQALDRALNKLLSFRDQLVYIAAAEAPPPEAAAAPPAGDVSQAKVVLELGYFVGKLGRSRVSVLYEPGVEMPSDYAGVVYTKLDPGGQWRFELLRELRTAGLNFDLNKLAGP